MGPCQDFRDRKGTTVKCMIVEYECTFIVSWDACESEKAGVSLFIENYMIILLVAI